MQLRATAFAVSNTLYVLVVFYFYVLFGKGGKFRRKEGRRELNRGREREGRGETRAFAIVLSQC